jgi:hypothetical protein
MVSTQNEPYKNHILTMLKTTMSVINIFIIDKYINI